MKEVSLNIFRLKNGGGERAYMQQSIQTSALQTTVSSKTEKQYREMAQQLFFSNLLSYLLCMCMCAALQVGDATHKIAALFYCMGVTVSLMTVSQKVLIGRLCVRGVTMQPAAGQEQQAAD